MRHENGKFAETYDFRFNTYYYKILFLRQYNIRRTREINKSKRKRYTLLYSYTQTPKSFSGIFFYIYIRSICPSRGEAKARTRVRINNI